MLNADAILAQLQSQRRRWVDVDAGIRLQIDTPSLYRAVSIGRALKAGDGEQLARELAPLVVGWEGVTEALLLGAGVGSADPVPVDARLWLLLAGDRPHWLNAVAATALEAATQARQAIEDAAKN